VTRSLPDGAERPCAVAATVADATLRARAPDGRLTAHSTTYDWELVSLNPETVVMRVPATAEHLALLRTVVHYYAGRANFTLDQIDDLKMAVDESGVQLLKHTTGAEIVLELVPSDGRLELRVGAAAADPVIDQGSFSWQILKALSDEVRIESREGWVEVVLAKDHTPLQRRGTP
jgi:serine/threonine-protein kinase RsbW